MKEGCVGCRGVGGRGRCGGIEIDQGKEKTNSVDVVIVSDWFRKGMSGGSCESGEVISGIDSIVDGGSRERIGGNTWRGGR